MNNRLKLKRPQVVKAFADVISNMYAEIEAQPPTKAKM